MAAIQADYEQAVDFAVTGLHGRLHLLPLRDTAYDLFLEPTVTVKEF
jgi:hypothetical protein